MIDGVKYMKASSISCNEEAWNIQPSTKLTDQIAEFSIKLSSPIKYGCSCSSF